MIVQHTLTDTDRQTDRQTDELNIGTLYGMKRIYCLKAKNGLGRFAPSALTHFYRVHGFNIAPRPQHSPCRIEEVANNKPAADLRTALLVATGDMTKRKTKGDKQIADFAKTVVDSAAVCATKDTAGGHGIDVCMCMAACKDTSYYLGWASRPGACHMLCSLATSPCTNE